MFDISENLLGIGLIQINTVASRQIFLVKIAVARPCLRGHKYDVSQDVRDLIAGRMQARDFDRLFARFSVPDECMAVARCRARTKINVVGTSGRSSLNWLYA